MEKSSIFVCAGDISADLHAASLITSLKQMAPHLHFWGVGGSAMKAAGMEVLYNCEDFACVGIIEVIKFLPFFLTLRNKLLDQLKERTPDAVLLVDFGGFNLHLATAIRKNFSTLPIIYFISPQLWGSRPWRIQKIVKTVSKMLVIFPFEVPLYRFHGVNVAFVGHPIAEKLASRVKSFSREAFCLQHRLKTEQSLVAIFPGSRLREIADLTPVIFQAIAWLQAERPQIQFVMSTANENLKGHIQRQIEKKAYKQILAKKLTLISSEHNHDLMEAADILWTKSGTITLEAALIGKPMLIFYRGNWLSFLILLLFKRVKYVGWPNLLLGEAVVPELLQLDCRAEQLVKYTQDWLDVPGIRKEIALRLQEIRKHFGEEDFAAKAANEVLATLRCTVH